MNKPRLTVIIVTFMIYAYFCGGYANNVIMNAIGDLTVAVTDDHSVKIDRYCGNSNDISERDGHFYSGFGPGLSFLLVPVYVALKPVLALIPESAMHRLNSSLSEGIYAKHGTLRSTESRAKVVMLIVAGTLLIAVPLGMLATLYIVRICALLFPALTRDDALRLAFTTAFGTIIAAFSIHLTHTAVASCLVWIAIARSLCGPKPAPASSTLINGLLLAFAPCVDYPASIYALYAAIFIVATTASKTRLKTGALLCIGALPSLLASWSYHFAAFGSPFTNAYRFRVRVIDRAIFDIRHPGPSLPNPQKLYVAFLHPNSGLVLYHPLLLVGAALAGYFFFAERQRLLKLLWGLAAVTMFTNIAIYCSYPLAVGPGGAANYGVRYTMYSAPFALLATAALLVRLPVRRVGRKALLALAILNSVLVLAFVSYGIPVSPTRDYGQLLTQIGPGNYTLTKLHEAHILNSPLWGWLGALLIVALLMVWRRAVAQLLADRPAEVPDPLPAPPQKAAATG